MVEYFNFTRFSDNNGMIDFLVDMSNLTKNYLFGYMLLALIFLIPTIYMIRNNYPANKAIHISSLYTFLMSIFFYVMNIVGNSEIIFICALVYMITASIRWYHRD